MVLLLSILPVQKNHQLLSPDAPIIIIHSVECLLYCTLSGDYWKPSYEFLPGTVHVQGFTPKKPAMYGVLFLLVTDESAVTVPTRIQLLYKYLSYWYGSSPMDSVGNCRVHIRVGKLLGSAAPHSIWLVHKQYHMLNSYALLLDSLMGHYRVWTWTEASNNVTELSMHTVVDVILLQASVTSALGSSVHTKFKSIDLDLQVPWAPGDLRLHLQTTVHWLEGKPILKEEGMSAVTAIWAQEQQALASVYKRGPSKPREASNNYSETHLTATILLPPQVFLPEPPSVGLNLILPMF
jgi:hypothetical protein